MANALLVISVLMALLAIWVGCFMTPRWIRRTRVSIRLREDVGGEAHASAFWLTRLATGLTESRLAGDDFKEIREAYDAAGKSREEAQLLYLLFCWILPAAVVVLAMLFLGALGAMLLAAAGFIIPRRAIRAMGRNAEARQNLEAVELCHLTRMLMEAGLSLERVLRVIAAQARPLLPSLMPRLDRFNRLMESGAERSLALDELGENRRIPVLRSYVVLMKQSGQLGAGVSDSLDQIITEAQKFERSRIEEETNRIGAKMTVVMMAFMLPALFILIGGPAVISIAEALSR